ncbi:MAG: SidE phosphodiesterase domain-containing protein [Zetaproteobacteria bacterium]|nr:SidE phosphodiesterase domain-containing protein [Zetaproteobacteria bacterium]
MSLYSCRSVRKPVEVRSACAGSVCEHLPGAVYEVGLGPDFFNSFELHPQQEPEQIVKRLATSEELATSTLEVELLDPNSPLRQWASVDGMVTIAYPMDSIELIPHTELSNLGVQKATGALHLAPALKSAQIDFNPHIQWKEGVSERPSSYQQLTSAQVRKKNIIEAIAKPLQEDMTLYRIVPKWLADKQVDAGRFTPMDKYFNINQHERGTAFGRRVGRGVYASDLENFHQLNHLADQQVARSVAKSMGLDYSKVKKGELTEMIRLSIPKGSRVIDLTNPKTRALLALNGVSKHDISYIDPNVSVRFHERSEGDFWVLKNMDNISITRPDPQDFAKIRSSRTVEKFLAQNTEIKAHFLKYAPKHVVQLRMKKSTFGKVNSAIFQPLAIAYQKLRVGVAYLYYLSVHLRQSIMYRRSQRTLHMEARSTQQSLHRSFISGQLKVVGVKDSLPQSGDSTSAIYLSDKPELAWRKQFTPPQYKLRFAQSETIRNFYHQVGGPNDSNAYLVQVIRDPLATEPVKSLPLGQKKVAYQAADLSRYFSTPYRIENYTTRLKTLDGKTKTVHRPNHGLNHGVRSGALSVDAANLFHHHFPESEIGKRIQTYMEKDPNFLNKVAHVGALCRSGRIGEGRDASTARQNVTSGAIIVDDPYLKKLVPDYAERLQLGRSLSFVHVLLEPLPDYRNPEKLGKKMNSRQREVFNQMNLSGKPLNEYEQTIGALAWLAHNADHRRMLHWNSSIHFKSQLDILSFFGIRGDDAQKYANTLWARSGSYLQATGSGDVEIYKYLGKNNNLWYQTYGKRKNRYDRPLPVFDAQYRHLSNEELFFDLENNPEKLQEVVAQKQRQMDPKAPLVAQPIVDLNYLMP